MGPTITHTAGSFGQVYLCYDQIGDYFYALKTLKYTPEALEDPHLLPRLQREVDIWIALGEHEHVVQCFALEVIDHIPFIVLEWVASTAYLNDLYHQHHAGLPVFLDWYARLGRRGLGLRGQQGTTKRNRGGTTLFQWLRDESKLSVPAALQIALDICDGLAHAQSIHPGLVHRDLKPANILLTDQLRAKVTDFGIAIIVEDLLDIGRSRGSALYKAPEQWRGEALDARTDIYALGCIMYEMLAGKPPFTAPPGKRDELRSQHEHAVPRRLPDYIPDAINRIVQTCLQKTPNARFASVTQLREELTAAFTDFVGYVPTLDKLKRPETVEEHNREGVTYYNLGKYPMALAAFERAIQLDSSYPNTYTNRGCVYHVLGQYEAALADYAQAIRLGREGINATVRSNRGLLHITRGQSKAALRDLQRAIEREPAYVSARVNLGLAYTLLGDYDRALAAYGQALQLSPKHVLALHNRGYVHQHMGDSQAAIDDYREAIAHAPSFIQAYINFSVLFTEQGKYEWAEHMQQRILRLMPSHRGELFALQAQSQLSQPEPQFINNDSLDEAIVRPFVNQRANLRAWEEVSGEKVIPRGRLPLQAVVRVEEVEYADWLHEHIERRQELGQHITQVWTRVCLMRGYGSHDDMGEIYECSIVIDDEAMRMLAAAGLRTIYDLKGHWLVLWHKEPDDILHPLYIETIH